MTRRSRSAARTGPTSCVATGRGSRPAHDGAGTGRCRRYRYALVFGQPGQRIVLTPADVAIVGGGPAGSALAIRLARAGITHDRLRAPARARVARLRSVLLATDARSAGRSRTLDAKMWRLERPISALGSRPLGGAACRIEYAHGHASGFDRVRLDAALLDRARDAGADVRMATVVRSVELPAAHGDDASLDVSPTVVAHDGERQHRQGARGGWRRRPGSIVARAGAARTAEAVLKKFGLTFHRATRRPRLAGQADGGPVRVRPRLVRRHRARARRIGSTSASSCPASWLSPPPSVVSRTADRPDSRVRPMRG